MRLVNPVSQAIARFDGKEIFKGNLVKPKYTKFPNCGEDIIAMISPINTEPETIEPRMHALAGSKKEPEHPKFIKGTEALDEVPDQGFYYEWKKE
tara:strand:- start:25802 stop:26086 length:285 start_codon:yes stop_codon:yes gene_type:complete